MREQRGLTSTGGFVHHDELTIRRLQPPQHLIRGLLLPRSALTAKITQPEEREILQRPPRLLHQRRINQIPRHRIHAKNGSGLKTTRRLITPLKPVSRRHTQTRTLSGLLNPHPRITGSEILLPLTEVNFLHAMSSIGSRCTFANRPASIKPTQSTPAAATTESDSPPRPPTCPSPTPSTATPETPPASASNSPSKATSKAASTNPVIDPPLRLDAARTASTRTTSSSTHNWARSARARVTFRSTPTPITCNYQ